jgi:cytochrome b6-f complex iron-sulfur subunit
VKGVRRVTHATPACFCAVAVPFVGDLMINDDAKPECPGNAECSARRLNRRELLSLAGKTTGLVVIGAALPGCGTPQGSPPTGPVTAGNVSALSVGTMLVISNIVVARDSGGVYGMSAVCTHAGCLLDDASDTIARGLYCACHGSSFNGDGVVTGGPARASLQHYAVIIAADGTITVDGSQPVAPDIRTVVPG